MHAGGFDQLTSAQCFQSHLHSALRQAGTVGDRAHTARDRLPVTLFRRAIKMKINKKSSRLLIMPHEIAHQNIEDVIIHWNSSAEASHGSAD